MLSTFKKIALCLTIALSVATPSVAQEYLPNNNWVPPATYRDATTGENYDIVVGRADAPVTIYEYASLTCPHCKEFQDVVAPQIKKKWIDTGKVKLVYRHFPLDQAALAAAMAVQCLPENIRYDGVKLFFSTVQQWASNNDVVSVLQQAYGPNFTLVAGQDLKSSMIACISRPDFANKAMASMLDASQNGVDSTPYFIIDGEHVRGAQPAEILDPIIQKHLDAKK